MGRTINAIFERRSIRRYTDQRIEERDVEMLLQAAMYAPSAGNERPWHFVVLRDKATLQAIENIHSNGKMLASADVAIVVCGDLNTLVHQTECWIMDCSAAMQNILLQATELKIGSVWLGVYPIPERVEAVIHILGLPKGVLPLGIAALGYPQREKPPRDPVLPQRIHFEHW